VSIGSVAVTGPRELPERGLPAAVESPERLAVLPPPASVARLDAGHALVMLQRILAGARENAVESGEARIVSQQELAKKAAQDAFDALVKQIEAEKDAGGFWSDVASVCGDIAKWAAVAASVALAVVSCGACTAVAALAIAGAVLSCAAAADSELGILEACGVDAETAGWIQLGMSIGGALCSGGASLASAAGTSASFLGEASSAVKTGASVSRGIQAGAGGAAAVARTVVGSYREDAKLAEADATLSRGSARRHEERVQSLLDTVKQALESHGRGLERVGRAMTEHSATQVAIVRA